MKIENLKDLQKLVQLCRKEGIEAFEIGEIKFNLGQKPQTIHKLQTVANDIPEANLVIPKYSGISTNAADIIKTNALTEEQLMMWSAQDAEQQG